MIDLDALENRCKNVIGGAPVGKHFFRPEVVFELIQRLRKAEKELLRYKVASDQQRKIASWEGL